MPSVRAELALLRNRRLTLLVASRTISTLGAGFGSVAVAFGVLALPGASPARLSIVQAALALPQLLVLVGGVLADRLPRGRLLVCAELLAAGGYAGIAVMFLTGWAPTLGLSLLAGLAGIGTALFTPAYTGVMPEVVPDDQLQTANALQRVGRNGGSIGGFALAGGCVALFGPGTAAAVDAVTFVVSAALLAMLRLPVVRRPDAVHPLRELRAGWREFRSRQWLWVIVAQFSVVVGAIAATLAVFGPMVADREFGGAPAWSLVMVGQMVGMMVGVVAAIRFRPKRPMLAATLCTLVFAVPLVTLGLGAPLWLIVVGAFVFGVSNDVFGVLWATTLQRQVPAESISRVSSWDSFGSLLMAPLALAVAGPVAAAVGVHAALIGGAALILLVTLAALTAPEVRGLRVDDQRQPAAGPLATNEPDPATSVP